MLVTVLFAAGGFVATSFASNIYETVGADGLPTYTNRATSEESRLVVRVVEPAPRPARYDESISARPIRSVSAGYEKAPRVTYEATAHDHKQRVIERTVKFVAKLYGVDRNLLRAVIKVESADNPNAISRAGAVGLMQLMPGTAARYGVTDRTDVVQSIDGGARYLRDLLDLFRGDVKLSLAAYNAGENAVIKYGLQIPPYPETRAYVVKVLETSARL